MSRIEATHDVSARYGLRSSVRCSSTTCRTGIVFHEGNRLPQSSCARPNWLKPAMASMLVGSGFLSRPRRQAKPQVAETDRDGLGGWGVRRSDLAVAAAVGRVDHVVQTERKPVDPKLRVPLAEAGEHDRLSRRLDRRRHDRGKTRCGARPSPARRRSKAARRWEKADRRRRRSRAHNGRRRRDPRVAESVPRPLRPDNQSSRRHRAARLHPRRSPPGS